jgi:hypothetical protein
VRIAAPLVAAWLWERVLISARRQAAARSTAQIRADHRLLAFARAAQRLRRLLNSPTASEPEIRRARRQFDRRHVALLRHLPATDPKLRTDIQKWLTELFSADTLYLDWTPPGVQNLSDTLPPVADSPDSRTHAADISAGVADSLVTFPRATAQVSVSRHDTNRDSRRVSDTAQTLVASAGQMSDAMLNEGSDTLSHSLHVSGCTQALTRHRRPTPDTEASVGARPDRVSDSRSVRLDNVADMPETCPPAFTNVSDTLASDRKRLSAAVDIVRTHGHLSGSDMAKQMACSGHPMSERTGLRWRDRAEEHRQSHQTLTPAG